ncbi:MAG: Bro-N domain-containing protein [Desulfovibrionaceae bacterium]|nr:Bro-N domain-containing protein [Desulfovibrionaceae bacterium]
MNGNEIQMFQSAEFGYLRVVMMDGAPWFVANDACKILEMGNPRSSLALLDDDEKGVHTVDTPGGTQRMIIVSEPDLYSLILRSRKPEAKTFKRWVTHDILPSIRHHGAYLHAPSVSPEYLREVAARLEEQARALKEARPSVNFHNAATHNRTFWIISQAKTELGQTLPGLRETCIRLKLLYKKGPRGRWWPTPLCFGLDYATKSATGNNWGFTPDGMEYLRLHALAVHG